MPDSTLLLPNLGAEEGDDWRAYRREPATRVAAHLWSLLFSRAALLRTPGIDAARGAADFLDRSISESWPVDLGPAPAEPAYAWLAATDAAVAWFRSATIDSALRATIDAPAHTVAGPTAEIVARVHDKAFALESARELDLLPDSLGSLITVLAPEDLASPDAVIDQLSTRLARWPDWTRGRFTLKPRLGSSGRGRVAGVGAVDSVALRGALPRLAARGGAIFEPWLDRRTDLSVCLWLPAPVGGALLPTLLGSLEMLTTSSGGYRGHCGELDHRGRVFSGHRHDEALRAQAAAVAARAQDLSYFGPCGIDAFSYVEDIATGAPERLRPAVEFNARPTMGLVALGLLRRALPARRKQLDLQPGERRAFLLTLLSGDHARMAAEISDASAGLGTPICLSAPGPETEAPRPYLFFAPELDRLRETYRRCVGC